jgi:transcriptional regulator with GAF, ATPase, and Fis domain
MNLETTSVPSPMEEAPGSKDLAAIASYLSLKTSVDLDTLLRGIERWIIVEALELSQGNQLAASRRLGVKYTTLNDKIRRHQIVLRKRVTVDVL